jgi:hypothetical protein
MEGGRSPIIEAGMNELVAEGSRACRPHATVDRLRRCCVALDN